MSERIYLSPPHMGPAERELLIKAFDSNWIAPLGPQVDAFEAEIAARLDVDPARVLSLSSGTAALHLALRHIGVGPGDAVLCASMTFVASVNPVLYEGATPVFVDAEAHSWNLDPALVASALERRPFKAVIAVDLYGQCADYDPLREACARHGVPLIEDAAEALGATYRDRPAGTLGDWGIFSFNGNKIITTSGGGCLICPTPEARAHAFKLATQARDPAPHYQHTEVGFNYRLSNLLAAVGRGQLSQLDARVDARRAINARYREGLAHLPGIDFMPEAPSGRPTFWLTAFTVNPDAFGATREDIRKALEDANIEARPVWKPMHMQPIFKDCEMLDTGVSSQIFEHGLCIPSGSALTAKDQERIVHIISSCHG